MKRAPSQLEQRENTASARRHASRRTDHAGSEQSGIAYAEEISLQSAASLDRRNAAIVGGDERLLTIQEVAGMLHVPVSWVYGRTRKRSVERLPGIRLGKYWRFREEEIHTWVESQRGGHRAP
jgi:excisionase family DNA binding protein